MMNFLLIVINLLINNNQKTYFFCDFDFYQFPISFDINRRIKLINIDDID